MAKFFTEIRTVSCLRICFVSLDKSVLNHRRWLKSKFSEMLILVYRKIFSAFYPILHETFSNNYGFPLMQEFNPFYPHLVREILNWRINSSLFTALINLQQKMSFPLSPKIQISAEISQWFQIELAILKWLSTIIQKKKQFSQIRKLSPGKRCTQRL